MSSVTFADVQSAKKRISPFINKTPVLESQLLNSWLGHKILFKAECFQKTGAFKIRGALNMILKAKEDVRMGTHAVSYPHRTLPPIHPASTIVVTVSPTTHNDTHDTP